MIVVSNTSPINYLVLIGEVDILPKIFERVQIPSAVSRELGAKGAPPAVRAWVSAPPSWLLIEAETRQRAQLIAELDTLDAGEKEAIALAAALDADLLLIDDRAGRTVAQAAGLRTVGTLGVLDRGDELGVLTDLRGSLDRLLSVGFRAAPNLIARILERHRRRNDSR